jgi:hypothetical protein
MFGLNQTAAYVTGSDHIRIEDILHIRRSIRPDLFDIYRLRAGRAASRLDALCPSRNKRHRLCGQQRSDGRMEGESFLSH